MTKFPGWARLITILVATGWIGTVYGVTMAICFGLDAAKNAGSPAYISKTMSSICTLDVPSDFKAEMALAMKPLDMVTLVYKPDSSVIMIANWPGQDKKHSTTREFVNDLADKSNPYVFQNFVIEKNGTISVAGETLEYSTGTAKDKEGKTAGAFVGCVIPRGGKKLIAVYGLTPGGPFNMKAMETLTAAIRGF